MLPFTPAEGQPVCCVAWDYCSHMMALCSLTPYAPILLVAYDPSLPAVEVEAGGAANDGAGGLLRTASRPKKKAVSLPVVVRCDL